MKITKPVAPERKLVAVIGSGEGGIYFKCEKTGRIHYLCSGELIINCPDPLETLQVFRNRTPVYEGDTITIQF